jgi:hypothetical protein
MKYPSGNGILKENAPRYSMKKPGMQQLQALLPMTLFNKRQHVLSHVYSQAKS